jgi:hypothetical protein
MQPEGAKKFTARFNFKFVQVPRIDRPRRDAA